jgi:hypothetical protein
MLRRHLVCDDLLLCDLRVFQVPLGEPQLSILLVTDGKLIGFMELAMITTGYVPASDPALRKKCAKGGLQNRYDPVKPG